MVTHDSYAASFCDRVILLKDGTVYNTLEKQGQSQNTPEGHSNSPENRSRFQERLLEEIKKMGAE